MMIDVKSGIKLPPSPNIAISNQSINFIIDISMNLNKKQKKTNNKNKISMDFTFQKKCPKFSQNPWVIF